MNPTTALTLIAALALASGMKEDWPNWLGPDRNGISAETNWSVEGKDTLWEMNVGRGYSSFAVVDGQLYTVGFDEEGGLDVVWCLDAETGDELWAHGYPAEIMNNAHGGGTLTTPTVDGDHVFVSSRAGGLTCLEAESGEVVWELNQKDELDLELPTWGFAASPLILGDQLIMNLGVVVSYDKESGDVKWKTKKNYGHAYSTPAPFMHDGAPALAVFAGNGLIVLSEADGKELFLKEWETSYAINAMTPIVVGDKIFISSGYNKGCGVFDLAAKGKVVWESKVMRSHMSGPTYLDGYLYGFDDSTLKCIDMDGEEIWRERGLGKGALVVADGKLILNSGDGELIVAAASPEGYKELSREKILDGGVYWTKPVLANGRIYSRNSLGDIAARDHRAK